jgi:hypothetical protein
MKGGPPNARVPWNSSAGDAAREQQASPSTQEAEPSMLQTSTAGLAADADLATHSGKAFGSWDLARTYGITDVDGSRPDWGAYYRNVVLAPSTA